MAPKPENAPSAVNYPMRLQKYLARCGVASRRGSEALISAGRVAVNGEVRTDLGCRVDPSADRVEVDGRPVTLADGCTYLILNKPAGYVTTMRDPHGRPCVAELVPTDAHPGLFAVGRLDLDTTGLLLFTTDGDMGNALLHPSHHVDKTYVAEVDGYLAEQDAEPLRAGGFVLPEGHICAPAQVVIEEADDRGSRVRITIHEGRKRQVRLMLAGIGHPVRSLCRISFGPLRLQGLAEGQWRNLTAAELSSLKEVAGL